MYITNIMVIYGVDLTKKSLEKNHQAAELQILLVSHLKVKLNADLLFHIIISVHYLDRHVNQSGNTENILTRLCTSKAECR